LLTEGAKLYIADGRLNLYCYLYILYICIGIPVSFEKFLQKNMFILERR